MSETPFRLYALDAAGEPECLAECDEYSLGEALIDLRRKQRTVRGIMFRPFDDEPGEWLMNPWETSAGGDRLASATKEPKEA